MTKHYKYQVSFSKEDGTVQNYKFKTMKEIQEFLNISYASLYNLRRGRLKCKHYTKSHLRDIFITKIEFEKNHYIKKNQAMLNKEEFYNSLEEKMRTQSESMDKHGC